MKTRLSKDQMSYARNDEEATVYVALKIIFDKMLSRVADRDTVEVNVNTKQLYYQVSGNYDMNRYDKGRIEKGLKGLIEDDCIRLIDTDGKDEYVLDIMALRLKSKNDGDDYTEPYTIMDTEEIHSVFNLSCKNKFGLLKFAVGLFGTINSTTKYGYCSFRAMPDYTYVTRIASCQDFFKLLEDNEIIYVRHCDKPQRDSNGQIKKISNMYGRPESAQEIDYAFEERITRFCHDFTNTMSAPRKTKLTKNYKKFLEGTYTGDIIELIQECLFFNDMPFISAKARTESNQPKDLSVFDELDIEAAKATLSEHIKKCKEAERAKRKEKEKEKKEESGRKFGRKHKADIKDLEDDLPY